MNLSTLSFARKLHTHFSPPDLPRDSSQNLSMELDLRNRQLELLNRNIPGGAHQCKNDPNFTLISMSDSFLSMVGYTREEVHTLFHNHFIEMVYPSDRALLLSTTREQLQKGRDIELEYRLLCKSGPPIWILDKGRLLDDGSGEENFFCLLIEITARKQEQEELRLSLERYQIIMDQATDIIFEWDIREDTLHFSPNWYKKFGYQPISEQISGRIPLSKNIHPQDMPAFVKIMRDSAAGVPYSETEFRIRAICDRYDWCRIRATTLFDSDHRAVKAVGVIIDIGNEKKQTQTLLDMAQKDALTGLYNKATIKSLVEHCMQENKGCGMQALFILDVDHFKDVNDCYGHPAGDSLLSSVAETIRKSIRQCELAGRIGGDEFLIYLPHVNSQDSAVKKAEQLIASLSMLSPEIGAPPISCSIGVAAFSSEDMTFQSLYKCADCALYARKKNGRGGVTLYSPELAEDTAESMGQPETRTTVDSDEHSVIDERLAQYTFRMLYSATDLQSSIKRLLEIIGRSYGVSRAYIFENSEDGLFCSNTFEWCAEGIEPQINRLQHIAYADMSRNYQENFDQEGIFYCADVSRTYPGLRAVLEPQGICSMLQCATMDEGEFVGYVGFDECQKSRAWSPKQIRSFKLTADVLSAFVIKLRLKQRQK